jgi:hypothetical protein
MGRSRLLTENGGLAAAGHLPPVKLVPCRRAEVVDAFGSPGCAETIPGRTPCLRLFVSWSGCRAGKVAGILGHYLERILPGARVFVSSKDIASGALWSHELIDALGGSDVTLVLLTRENLDSSWLAYEAGGSRLAVPVLLGDLEQREVTGPLSLHQSRAFTRADLVRLSVDLARLDIRGGSGWDHATFDDDAVARRVNEYWPKLREEYARALGHKRVGVLSTADLRRRADRGELSAEDKARLAEFDGVVARYL